MLGGVSDRTGAVALSKPDGDRGELVVSTRIEEQLLGSTRRMRTGLFASAGIAIAGGIALLVLAAFLA